MIEATFRPLGPWPRATTPDGSRRRRPFKAPWADTLALLSGEIGLLDGRAVIIAAGFREQDIRNDGWPRATAREPDFPGVEVSFDTRYGRLVYPTDVCDRWRDNVRSIALGLKALRAVDRFGVAERGQQYAGWKALGSGDGEIMSTLQARAVLAAAFGGVDDASLDVTDLYRRAARAAHPDTGGSAEAFQRVQKAYRLLRAAGAA